MKTKILVTGGAGYIGSPTCKALADAGYTPVVLDNLSAGRRERVQWGPLEVGDIRDAAMLDKVMDSYQPAAVMHFAALISVADSVLNPAATFDVNVSGTEALLQAMLRHGVKTLVFSSTAAVYGTPTVVPIPETAPTQPINPYGQSKLMMEKLLAEFHARHNFSTACLRYFNAAGALAEAGLGYQRPDPTHLLPLAMMSLLGQRDPLAIFGDDYPTPDGTAIRDYIHVADLAEAHVLALRHLLDAPAPQSLTLNLGTSHGYSVREVLAAIEQAASQPVPTRQAPRREGDPAMLVADARKAKDVLGWEPARSGLASIVADDLAWHRQIKG